MNLAESFPALEGLQLGIFKDYPIFEVISKFKDYEDRVELCLHILKDFELNFEASTISKSESDATKFKEAGNVCCHEGRFREALLLYNKGIAHAPKDSPVLGLLYANRSLVFLETRLYDKCLQNINQARTRGYPNSNWAKLEKRRLQCLEAMDRQEKQAPVFDERSTTLKNGPQKRNPFVDKSVNLRFTKMLGFHAVAATRLEPGEIVMLHEPLSWYIQGDFVYGRCLGCFKVNNMNFGVACKFCNRAIFCSERCKETANRKFHYFECRAISKLEASFDYATILAIRNTLLGLHFFPDLDELERVVEEIDKSPQIVLAWDFGGPVKEKNLWKLLYAYRPKTDHWPPMKRHKMALDVALAFKILLANSASLTEKLKAKNDQRLFTRLLLHFASTANLTAKTLVHLPSSSRPNQEEVSTEAEACFPFAGFLTHSCMSNVALVNVGRDSERMMNFATRPISAGRRLTATFEPETAYYLTSKKERNERLVEEFNVVCDCSACFFDYPQLKASDLGVIAASPVNKSMEERAKIVRERLRSLKDLRDDEALAKDHIKAQIDLYAIMSASHSNENPFVNLK